MEEIGREAGPREDPRPPLLSLLTRDTLAKWSWTIGESVEFRLIFEFGRRPAAFCRRRRKTPPIDSHRAPTDFSRNSRGRFSRFETFSLDRIPRFGDTCLSTVASALDVEVASLERDLETKRVKSRTSFEFVALVANNVQHLLITMMPVDIYVSNNNGTDAFALSRDTRNRDRDREKLTRLRNYRFAVHPVDNFTELERSRRNPSCTVSTNAITSKRNHRVRKMTEPPWIFARVQFGH